MPLRLSNDDATVAAPAGGFDGAIELVEWNPREGGTPDDDQMVNAPGNDLAVAEPLELTDYTPGG